MITYKVVHTTNSCLLYVFINPVLCTLGTSFLFPLRFGWRPHSGSRYTLPARCRQTPLLQTKLGSHQAKLTIQTTSLPNYWVLSSPLLLFTASGFLSVWSRARPGLPGSTCCTAALAQLWTGRCINCNSRTYQHTYNGIHLLGHLKIITSFFFFLKEAYT